MISDLNKWQELRAWADDKVRLESNEDAVFFVLLLSKMAQLDSIRGRPFPLTRPASFKEMYPDTPYDGEEW